MPKVGFSIVCVECARAFSTSVVSLTMHAHKCALMMTLLVSVQCVVVVVQSIRCWLVFVVNANRILDVTNILEASQQQLRPTVNKTTNRLATQQRYTIDHRAPLSNVTPILCVRIVLLGK